MMATSSKRLSTADSANAQLGRVPTGGNRMAYTGVWNARMGLSGPAVSNTPYADMLGNIQSEQQDLYDAVYRPVAQQFITGVNSTALIDSAKESAGVDRVAANTARGARQVARLGVTATPAQSLNADYAARLGATVTNDGNINKARADQQTRNDAVRTEVINIGRGIAKDSTNSAISAAASETSRNNTNSSIDAQNTAARNQTFGTLAGMAIMMMM